MEEYIGLAVFIVFVVIISRLKPAQAEASEQTAAVSRIDTKNRKKKN